MSISVITTTISLGGLDMLINSMKAQVDAPQFEVIYVDEWHEARKRFVDDYFIPAFRHVPPTPHDYIDHCAGWNTGLRHAEGELICFLNDYIWAYPYYLRDHWNIYKNLSGYSASGYLDRYPWPAMNDSKEIEDVWWTSFTDEFTAERARHYFDCVEPVYRERKGGMQGERIGETEMFRMPGDKWYASLNDSIPLAVLKEINGWDERFDGGYASQDIHIGIRAEMVGWKFCLLPTCNYKIGVYGLPRLAHSIVKPWQRSAEDNPRMFVERIAAIREGRESVRTPSPWGAWE